MEVNGSHAVRGADSSDSSSVINLSPQQAALQILQEQPWERKEKAMSLLLKIVKNIHENPKNTQYRVLNEFNQTLSTKLFSVPGCLEYLQAIGFQHFGSSLAMLDSNLWRVTEKGLVDNKAAMLSIQSATLQLQDYVEKETTQQKRKEMKERIAKERASEETARPLRCRARTALREEEQARRDDISHSAATAQLTVHLQNMSNTIDVTVPIDESVGYLRSCAAESVQQYAHQIKLVSLSTGGVLRWDHEKLRDCGIQNGSTVMFSVEAADEMEAGGLQLVKRFGKIAEPALHNYEKNTWEFTRACLEAAAQYGLSQNKLMSFKRSLHSGELSPQQIRDLITQEIQEITGDPTPLEGVRSTYLFHDRAATRLTKTAKDLEYSMQLSRDNANGIIHASTAGAAGNQPKLPYYM